MTDDQDIQEVLKLMSGPLPLLPSRSEGNTVILRGAAEARRRGLAAVYAADVGRGILQIGIRQFHRDVIQVEGPLGRRAPAGHQTPRQACRRSRRAGPGRHRTPQAGLNASGRPGSV